MASVALRIAGAPAWEQPLVMTPQLLCWRSKSSVATVNGTPLELVTVDTVRGRSAGGANPE